MEPKKKKIVCSECDGIGETDNGEKCQNCDGTGWIEATIKEQRGANW